MRRRDLFDGMAALVLAMGLPLTLTPTRLLAQQPAIGPSVTIYFAAPDDGVWRWSNGAWALIEPKTEQKVYCSVVSDPASWCP